MVQETNPPPPPPPFSYHQESPPLCFLSCSTYVGDRTNLGRSKMWRLDTIGISGPVVMPKSNHIALRDLERKIIKENNRFHVPLIIKELALGSENDTILQRSARFLNFNDYHSICSRNTMASHPSRDLGSGLFGTKFSKYIQGEPNRWRPFARSRAMEIQELARNQKWHHCRSEENPADMLTRGISASHLLVEWPPLTARGDAGLDLLTTPPHRPI